MAAPLLEKYKKVAGTGPGSTIDLADWNGLLDDLSGTLAQLIQKGADFDAVATVAIGILLDRINDVLGPAYDQVTLRGQQIEALYASISGMGIPAASVIESPARYFLTDDRRASILSDLRGGVSSDYDTLSEIVALIGARTAGIVVYNAVQNLQNADRLQFKKNIKVEIGRRYYTAANNGGSTTVTLTAADIGALVYLEGDITALKVPLAANYTDGDTFRVYCRGTVLVSATTGDPYTFGFADFNRPSFTMLPGDRCDVTLGADAWDVISYTTTHNKALMADRAITFTDTEKAQLASNLGLDMPPACQGRLIWVNNNTLRLFPQFGNYIFINGKLRKFSSNGVDLGLAGTTNGGFHYIYAYWDGSQVALVASGVSFVRDAASGILTISGDPRYTLVGIAVPLNIGNGVQWLDQDDYRYLLSYYNRIKKRMYIPYATGQAGSTITEYGTRANFISLGEDHTEIGVVGLSSTSTFDNNVSYLDIDGTQVGPQMAGAGATNAAVPLSQYFPVPVPMGVHYLRLMARSGGSTITVSHAKVGAVFG